MTPVAGQAPKVSFVVLNYNGGQEVLACLESVLAQREGPCEAVVVDNGSVDGSVELLRGKFSGIRWVLNGRNVGFAEGMNRGIMVADGDIIVPLNQDVVLDPGFARHCREAFAADERIGAVGGVIHRMNDAGPTDDFDAGGYYLRRRLGVGPIGRPANRVTDVFGVSGCCPAFRRAMLEDIRLAEDEFFDNSYFLYFEDLDLFFRAQLRSWRVVYLSSVMAWHRRSWSTGGGRRFYQKPRWIQRLHLRNRHLTLIKNCPVALAPRLLPAFLAAEVLLWPYLVVKAPLSLICVVQSWWDVLRRLPGLLETRRRIQAGRTASAAALGGLIRGI